MSEERFSADWLQQREPFDTAARNAAAQRLRLAARLAQQRSSLPAITHIDYSARVQTVSADTNPRFYQLLQHFKAQTGTSVLINTSFNVRGEPPVCSPADALQGFFATDMDVLVLGNCG